jgi:short-subunit dehydrogenase
MDQLRGRNALVTGGSSGIGRHIARALAMEGMRLVVSARRADALDRVVAELRALGTAADAVVADLSDPEAARTLVARATEALGPPDVVVNNAGMELTAAFTAYSSQELVSVVHLDLLAPLLVTHAALPGMLERGRGHIVFMSSVAGKIAPPYEEPYAASKAGLIALAQSLRSEYRGSPIGFSVVCPGFVAGDGMYQRMLEQGLRSNRVMGETTVERVVDAVLDAIRRDRAEVIESGTPLRPLAALAQIAPGLVPVAQSWTGVTGLFRRMAATRGRLTVAPGSQRQ